MARLAAENLTFRYEAEEEPIIENFSCTLPDRGIVGLLGPNGIGKSTLMALLAGALAPESGSVLIKDRPTSDFRSEEEINEAVTFIFQNMEFEIDETVAAVMDMVASLNPETDHASCKELRSAFGIEKLADTSIQKISKGELQKVILCFALLSKPAILILDEPVFALSYEDATAALQILKEYAEKREMLVVLSLHDIGQMEKFSEYVILFHKDRSYEYGPAEKILKKEKLEEVYGTPYSLLKLPRSVSSVMDDMTATRDSLKDEG